MLDFSAVRPIKKNVSSFATASFPMMALDQAANLFEVLAWSYAQNWVFNPICIFDAPPASIKYLSVLAWGHGVGGVRRGSGTGWG